MLALAVKLVFLVVPKVLRVVTPKRFVVRIPPLSIAFPSRFDVVLAGNIDNAASNGRSRDFSATGRRARQLQPAQRSRRRALPACVRARDAEPPAATATAAAAAAAAAAAGAESPAWRQRSVERSAAWYHAAANPAFSATGALLRSSPLAWQLIHRVCLCSRRIRRSRATRRTTSTRSRGSSRKACRRRPRQPSRWCCPACQETR